MNCNFSQNFAERGGAIGISSNFVVFVLGGQRIDQKSKKGWKRG